MSGKELESALEFARKWIDADDAIGHTIRRVAQEGTLDDLLALARELYDDLQP